MIFMMSSIVSAFAGWAASDWLDFGMVSSFVVSTVAYGVCHWGLKRHLEND